MFHNSGILCRWDNFWMGIKGPQLLTTTWSRPLARVWSGLQGGFTLRSKTKDTPKLNNHIGQEPNFGSEDNTLGFESKAWKIKWRWRNVIVPSILLVSIQVSILLSLRNSWLNFKVGSNLEFERKVQQRMLWSPSFLELNPNVNLPSYCMWALYSHFT